MTMTSPILPHLIADIVARRIQVIDLTHALTPEFPPIESWTPRPEEIGSGKFDTPWARMHLENASACE